MISLQLTTHEKRRFIMAEFFRKSILAGIGLITEGSEKMKELVDDLVKKGEVSRKDGEKLLEDLLKRGEEARKGLSKRLSKGAENILDKADIATKEDIEKLNKRIAALEKKLKGTAKSR